MSKSKTSTVVSSPMWAARLTSDYRGLSQENAIELRPFTCLIGPNNGGKTQYLRSLVLLDATRQVLSSPIPSLFYLPEAPKLVNSISQALSDFGFADLAEEIGELLGGQKGISLAWETTFQDVPTVGQVMDEYVDRMLGRRRQKSLAPEDFKAQLAVSIKFEPAINDIVVERFVCEGLWEGLKFEFIKQPKPVTELKEKQEERLEYLFQPVDYQVMVTFKGKTQPFREFAKEAVELLKAGSKRELPPHWTGSAVNWLLQRGIALLPSVAYLGPVRVADDRQYAVGSTQNPRGVGRFGELTWVQLRDSRRLTAEAKAWFQHHVHQVLGLREVESSRESPTVPKITAYIGDLQLPLHNYGLGSSQALPILLQLALTLPAAKTDRPRLPIPEAPPLVIVEEPESHLHPGAQRAMATAFADYISKGGRLLVETHSDILVKAFELKIASKTIEHEAAGVNSVDLRPGKPKADQLTRFLAFSEDGSLSGDLPASFDQVGAELIEARFSLAKE